MFAFPLLALLLYPVGAMSLLGIGLISAVVEEVGKFILALGFKKIEGFYFGLGWGIIERILYGLPINPYFFIPILFHTFNAVILFHFVRKKKYLLGLVLAITLHILYNLAIIHLGL